MAYQIKQEICAGCHICELSCPVGAIRMNFSKYQIDADKCIGCGTCAQYCHNAAIYDPNRVPVALPEQETQKKICDILVIGAGASGLVAAAKASDAGKRVIILEKNFEIGGSAYFGHMMRSHYSKWHQEAGFPDRRSETYAEFVKKTQGRCDNDLALDLLNANVDLTNWLIDSGCMEQGFEHKANGRGMWDVKQSCISKYPFDALRSDASCGPGESGWVICNILADYAVSHGAELLLNSTAKHLITDESGAVVGVEAHTESGRLEIQASAVLMCAGSYSHNREIMEKMQPDFYGQAGDEPIHIYACSTCTGDGITMCDAIGADIDYTNRRAAMFGPVHHPFSYGVITLLRGGGNELLVNKYGAYVEQQHKMTEIGEIASMPGRIGWAITDQQALDSAIHRGAMPGNVDDERAYRHCLRDLENELRDGSVLKGNTLEELAEKACFDKETFFKAIARYNEQVRSGKVGFGPGGPGGPGDEPGGPDGPGGDEGMPPMGPMTPPHTFETGPFYAVFVKGFQENAVGGMVIDRTCAVLRNGAPIPGLYACGDNTRGIMLSGDIGVQYIEGYLSAMTYAMTSGYLAAENAIAGLENKI